MAETAGAESFAAFARRLGVNRSTVTRAAQSGRLVVATLPDGSRGVAIAASLQAWHATRGLRDDVALRHAEARGATIPLPGHVAALGGPVAAPATPSATQTAPPAPSPLATSRVTAQAATLHWQNQFIALQLQLDAAQQLPAEAVLAELQGLGANLRGLAERLVDQLAPRLAVAGSVEERQRLLQAELRAARHQLRHAFPRALRRLVQAARPTSQDLGAQP